MDSGTRTKPYIRRLLYVGLCLSIALWVVDTYSSDGPPQTRLSRSKGYKRLKRSKRAKRQPRKVPPLTCRDLTTIMDKFHGLHVQFDAPSSTFNKKVANLFMDQLDSSKLLLTQSQLKKEKRRLGQLVSDVRKGRCHGLKRLKERRIQLLRELVEFSVAYTKDPTVTLRESVGQQRDSRKRKRAQSVGGLRIKRQNSLQIKLAEHMAVAGDLDSAKAKLRQQYKNELQRYEKEPMAEFYERFLRAFANAMDPHSEYFNNQEHLGFDSQMNLSFVGIGIEVVQDGSYTITTRVLKGSPADKEGRLRPKDRIIAITPLPAGKRVNTVGMPIEAVCKHLTGELNSKVKLTVTRMVPKASTFDVVITRRRIELKDEKASLSWHSIHRNGSEMKLAVVTLKSFYRGEDFGNGPTSARDIRRLLWQATEGGAQGLVLDLSENGGGLLDAAVRIVGLFMESPAVVMSDGSRDDELIHRDLDRRVIFARPLVVLTSRISASAAEVTAAALKDYGRAAIVGDTKTWGKGTYQTVTKLLSGNGAVKVTRGRIFRPNGRSTQYAGVTADVKVPSRYSVTFATDEPNPFALPVRRMRRFADNKQPIIKSLLEKFPWDEERWPDSHWQPVTPEDKETLVRHSAARLAKRPEYQAIVTQQKTGLRTVGEILNRRHEQKRISPKKEAKLRLEEALEVLGDLVTLHPRSDERTLVDNTQ